MSNLFSRQIWPNSSFPDKTHQVYKCTPLPHAYDAQLICSHGKQNIHSEVPTCWVLSSPFTKTPHQPKNIELPCQGCSRNPYISLSFPRSLIHNCGSIEYYANMYMVQWKKIKTSIQKSTYILHNLAFMPPKVIDS
jgi:hypothetical protein